MRNEDLCKQINHHIFNEVAPGTFAFKETGRTVIMYD